jgi:hypothetical protein
MLKVAIDGKELVFGDNGVVLIILGHANAIYNAFELSIDEEEEAGVEGGVLEHTRAVVDFDLTVVVHIGHTSSDGKVLGNVAVIDLNLRGILNVEHSALVSVVPLECAIVKVSGNSLVVGKNHRASAHRVVLRELAIGHP